MPLLVKLRPSRLELHAYSGDVDRLCDEDHREEEDEDVELLEDIQEELNEMKSTTKKSHQDMMREIGKITHQVEKFITKMEEDADNEGENEEDEKNK